jgi:protein-tyrosine phosphatase
MIESLQHHNTRFVMIKNVLIICIGNICRSPIAEAMLAHKLADQADMHITSAGLAALVGQPVDSHAVKLIEGLDVSAHKARQLTAAMVADADLILTTDQTQTDMVVKMLPNARAKTFTLGKWDNMSILDPYQKNQQAFVNTHHNIDKCTTSWANKIKALKRKDAL